METSEVTTTNSESTDSKSEVNINENVNKTDEAAISDNVELTTTTTTTATTSEETVTKSEPDLKEESEQNDNANRDLTWESVAAEIQAHEEATSQYEIVPDTQNGGENILTTDGDNTIQTTTITTTIEDTITTTTPSTTETPVLTQSDVVDSNVSHSTTGHSDNLSDDIELLMKDSNETTKTNDEEKINTETVVDTVEETTVDKEKETTIEEPKESIDELVEEVPSENIVITELKPDEVTQLDDDDDVVSGVEYTVIEADDSADMITETESTTEEIVLVPIDDDNDTNRSDENSQDVVEEVFIIKNDDDSSNAATSTSVTGGGGGGVDSAESVDDPDDKPKQTKPKKPRGRRPIADIPLHVLGRDITKPTEGVSNGGRTMPKPRLGVKVPYKNLTSQIVSKEEIQKEIMDRFKQRQEQTVASGDILFARKLTQRLAKKLGPVEKTSTSETTATITAATPTTTTTTTNIEIVTSQENQEKKIEIKKSTETINPNMNNSDLIAILEGDADDPQIIEKHTESKVFAEKQQFVRDIEKEIALQQLRELPLTKNRIFKSRGQTQQSELNKITNILTAKKTANENPTTSSVNKKTTDVPIKKTLDLEPQLKAEQVVKTYTRKRRSFELDTILPVKKAVVKEGNMKNDETPTNPQSSDVYVTKSSRIIKKKVIWDPDEAPIRSPVSSTTTTITSKTTTPTSSPPKAQQQQTQNTEKSSEKKPVATVKKTQTSPVKKPKRLSEVDRLLMDEGAVNMLYDVKQNDDGNQEKNKNKNKKVISLDKAHKELISKTNVIKNDLQQNTIKESGVSLRKKETPSPKKEVTTTTNTITRKKTKDSSKNSTHNSPPASPSFSAEASRIIRRHSSSSFSSNDGIADGENENSSKSKKKSAGANNEPPKKKFKKPTDVSNKTNISNNSNNNNNNNNNNSNNNNNAKVEKDTTKYKTFAVVKMNTLVSIELNYTETKYYLTDEVLRELTVCLNELSHDNDCHVVAITSSGGDSFCHGIDYRCLVTEDVDTRKNKAVELCNLIKNFIRCLLHFPKVLIAGIQGDCVGLGVTMLPLFDMVIASDTSTFSTPYGCLGCAPEAGFLLGVPYLNNHGLASELLYTSQTVKAEDAVRSGLVTRLCWPEKYHNELKSLLTEIASQSRQSIEATKAQLRRHLFESTEKLLDSSMDKLVEQWITAECQKNFVKYKVEPN